MKTFLFLLIYSRAVPLSLPHKIACLLNRVFVWWRRLWENQPQATIPTCREFTSEGLFILNIQTTAPKFTPEHCPLFDECGAYLDGGSAHVGLWIKHVALIKNNLAQKCQRPLRSITGPLLSIHSLHLTGFKERGTWLAAARFRECIQILYDPAVNVLSRIK